MTAKTVGQSPPNRADRKQEKGAAAEDKRNGENRFHVHGLPRCVPSPARPETQAIRPEPTSCFTTEQPPFSRATVQTSSTSLIAASDTAISVASSRSEERRVGKECRSLWWP